MKPNPSILFASLLALSASAPQNDAADVELLQLYLGLAASEVEKALGRMLDGSDNELALQMAIAAEAGYPNEAGIRRLKEEAGVGCVVQFNILIRSNSLPIRS